MKYNYKKIALTGATSSIGIAIINECIKNRIEVLAFVQKDSLHRDRIPQSKYVKIVNCSLEEMITYENNNHLSADVLFHLAWGSTKKEIRSEIKPQIQNINYSIDSVGLAHKLNCKVYVGAGSQAEFGRSNEKLNEESITKPETAYGMAKLCFCQMTRLECRKYGIKHIWPRIFSTYGPNSQENTILSYTISSILRNESPKLTACEQIWDFMYVDDAARAMMLLAQYGRDGEIYCVSSGKSGKMRDFIGIVSKELKKDVEIGYGILPYSDNTVMHLEGDIEKLQRDTGFVAQVPFEEGIARTITWMNNYFMKSKI